VLVAVALLAATASHGAHAQGVRRGDMLTPESSIEYREDIGVRAHTNLHIVVSPGKGIHFDGGEGPGGGMTPAQIRQAYSLPSTGGSQIIAIVDAYDDPNALADFNTFSAQFGLPQETSTSATASTNKVFQVVYANGSQPSTDPTGGWEVEEALDIEWAHAIAPNAKVILVEASSASFTDLLVAEATATGYVDANGLAVKEVSNSWSGSEFSGENAYDRFFTSRNVVYFFSAGDSGAPAEYPSASPYVVSVGGTTVNTNSSGVFTGEVGWSRSGGGPSAYEPRPAFQSAISGIVGAWRGTPDLSFDADPDTGVSVYDTFPSAGWPSGWAAMGGTSLSAVAVASIANLAATAAGSFPAGSQALLATIYSRLGSANFRDITSGNNGYAATVGWDFVTGIGTCVGLAGLQSIPVHNSWDFYRDGNTGVLWYNTLSSNVGLWDIDDTKIVNQGTVSTGISAGWQVVGSGYFDTAGDLGMVWFNSLTRDVYLWDMQGSTIVNQGYVWTHVPPGWQIVGTGDFYGDGLNDILWFNVQTGDVYLWELDDTRIINQGYLCTNVPSGWQIMGTGYFDALGALGIVWFNASSGDVYLWDVYGGSIINQGYIALGVPAGWMFAGVGYFDRANAYAGILWFNASSGDVYLWDVRDAGADIEIADQGYVGRGVAAGWQIAGIRNDSNSPYGEILWFNAQTRDVYLWDVSDTGAGIGVANQGYLAHGVSAGWQIVNPQ
jgi:hypothetical protein